MHERYLFPALLFALLTYLYTLDRRVLVLFAGFSVTHFLNVAGVLAGNMAGIYRIAQFDPLLLSVSVANLLLFGYTIGYGVKLLRGQVRREM